MHPAADSEAAAAVEAQTPVRMESLAALSEKAPWQRLRCWGACCQRTQAMVCVEVERHIVFNMFGHFSSFRSI